MQITVLSENTSANDLIGCEHGLSIYIETAEHKILFDMGQTPLFAENARKLAIDLAEVDFAVLSHGHYDHGGGLETFFELNKKAKVYIPLKAFGDYYNASDKYIGLDCSLKDNERLIFTAKTTVITDNITLHDCNDRKRRYNLGSFGLKQKTDGKPIADNFDHEHYLLIEENGRRILFSGCSHKGILNIVEWFNPDILIGGFHFSKLPLDETLTGYAENLERHSTVYYTCHCTGSEQYNYMKKTMSRLYYISAGETITV